MTALWFEEETKYFMGVPVCVKCGRALVGKEKKTCTPCIGDAEREVERIEFDLETAREKVGFLEIELMDAKRTVSELIGEAR